MPIYAYKCSSCGFAEDVLQKLSDAPLTDCPSCGAAALHKQVTAASFRLKGSGWYVTDFRNEGGAPAAKDGAAGDGGKSEPAASGGATAETAPAAAPTASPPAAGTTASTTASATTAPVGTGTGSH